MTMLSTLFVGLQLIMLECCGLDGGWVSGVARFAAAASVRLCDWLQGGRAGRAGRASSSRHSTPPGWHLAGSVWWTVGPAPPASLLTPSWQHIALSEWKSVVPHLEWFRVAMVLSSSFTNLLVMVRMPACWALYAANNALSLVFMEATY